MICIMYATSYNEWNSSTHIGVMELLLSYCEDHMIAAVYSSLQCSHEDCMPPGQQYYDK